MQIVTSTLLILRFEYIYGDEYDDGLRQIGGELEIKTKMKKPAYYDKIEKSESMRVEIRSRKARKLIEETMKIADSPRTSKTYAF
ncbi:hypothetical protein QQP08_013310 [Theobroma cacao]|nr:hypothetical protein QQP08_013310 [Theobroma cacao]